jgi:hypothetical protein
VTDNFNASDDLTRRFLSFTRSMRACRCPVFPSSVSQSSSGNNFRSVYHINIHLRHEICHHTERSPSKFGHCVGFTGHSLGVCFDTVERIQVCFAIACKLVVVLLLAEELQSCASDVTFRWLGIKWAAMNSVLDNLVIPYLSNLAFAWRMRSFDIGVTLKAVSVGSSLTNAPDSQERDR